MKKITFLILVSTFLLVSCSNTDKSAKFAGTWKNVLSDNFYYDLQINIEKVGENFTVQPCEFYKVNTPSHSIQNPEYWNKMSASYNKENDKLVVSENGGSVDLIYDLKSDHIIFNGKEYQKSK